MKRLGIAFVFLWCAVLAAMPPDWAWYYLSRAERSEQRGLWQSSGITPADAVRQLLFEVEGMNVPPTFAGRVAELHRRVEELTRHHTPWNEAWRRVFRSLRSYRMLFALQARLPQTDSAFVLTGLAKSIFLLNEEAVLTGELSDVPIWHAFPGGTMQGMILVVPYRPEWELSWSAGAITATDGTMALPASSVRVTMLTPEGRHWNYAPAPVTGVAALVVRAAIPRRISPGRYYGRVAVTDRRSGATKRLNYELMVLFP